MSNSNQDLSDVLILNFLGTPYVSYGGQYLKFRSRKVLALLIYLVVEGGQHYREKLITMFWQESGPKQGKVTLRSTLARLKKTLSVAGSFLITEKGRIGFDNSQDYWLDLHYLDTHFQSGTPEQLQAILASVQGEFLEGFSLPDAPEFDDWMMIQREIWHRRVGQAFDRLAQLQMEQGQQNQAVETAASWVAHDPFNEAAYKRLMETHILTGNRSATLQVYEQCRNVLAEELGVLPSSDLDELVEHVRSPDYVARSSRLSQSTSPTRPSSIELPFVGRAAEHQQLISTYQQTCQQDAQVVTIISESGLGKTRLCHAFLDWVRVLDKTADILNGRAFEMGGRFPYQPVIEALRRRLDEENAPEDLLSDIWLAELSRLFPELRDRYPDLPVPFDGDAEFVRVRIFEAIARLGEALAQKRPVVIFLDDMQWADDDSLDLLHYLIRRWREQQISILTLITLRHEALLARPLLQEWLNQLGRDTPLLRVNLAPLNLRDVTLLVSHLAGLAMPDGPTQHLSQWLYDETQGHPFFLAEMLQMLAERNLLIFQSASRSGTLNIPATLNRIEGIEQLPLPPTIREVILARLGHLGETATALLLAGAVLGREVTFEQLSNVSGVNEVTALTNLEVLLKTRLLVESGSAIPKYAFSHDKIREAVYGEASEARRRIYHRRALVVLTDEEALSAELAFHALAAHQVDLAIRHSLAAGDTALNTYALSEAFKHFAQVEALIDKADVSSEDLLNLYRSRGRALELAHRFDDALANYEELDSLSQQLDNQEMRLASLIGRAVLFATPTPISNPIKGKFFSGEALNLARLLADGETETRALWSMMLVHHYGLGEEESARNYGEAALALALELGIENMLAYILNDLHWVYVALGNFRLARHYLENAIEHWQAMGNISMLLDSLNGAGILYSMVGEFDLALAIADKGTKLAKSVGNIWNQIAIQANLLWVYREQARYDLIIPIIHSAIDFAQATMPNIAIYYQSSLALIYADLGLTESADAICTHMLQHYESTPAFWQLRDLAYAIQTRLHLLQGNLSQAHMAIENTQIDSDSVGIAHASLMVPLWRCEVFLAQGEYAKVIDEADQFIASLEHSGIRLGLAEAYFYKGQSFFAQGQFEAAHQTLSRARDEAHVLGIRRMLWKILMLLADIEDSLNNQANAVELRREACSILDNVIEDIPDGEMRASFLVLPEVQALMKAR